MCIWRQCKKDPSAALGMTKRGSGWIHKGDCAAFLEEGILVSQPSPLGEGAPQGRIGYRRYEREWDEDRKLLIKGRKQSFTWLVLFTLLSFGSRFRGKEADSPPFFIGAMPGSGI